MTRVRFAGICVCVVAALLTGTSVDAAPVSVGETVEVNLSSYNPTASVKVSSEADPDKNYSGPAGVFNWSVLGGNSDLVVGSTLHAFCIEITQYVNYTSDFTYTVKNLADAPVPGPPDGMGDPKGKLITELYDRFYSVVLDGNGEEAAAFQLAIWNIVYDDDHTAANPLGGGNFHVNSGSNASATTRANAMLGALTGSFIRTWDLFALSYNNGGNYAQDHVIAFERETTTTGEPIPTPAAGLMGLPVLAMLGITRPKRHRAA